MADIPTYEVDLNDSRLTGIKNEEATELNNLEANYNTMSTNTDKYYDTLIKGYDDYAKQQTDIANKSLGLTIKEIEQNKADTEKDYIKEQSGAYVDWQQQSNQYGANAEQMAASGLTNTGFSESSQVSMYNTYQNRVATARETFNRAIVDYNNQISQARLANDTLLAEIAFNALKQSTELSIQQVQYKNQLLQDLTTQRTAMKQSYWQRYSDMMGTIQREIAQKEEARQYNETLAEQKRVNDSEIAYRDAQTALAKKELEVKRAQIDAANRQAQYNATAKGGNKDQKANQDKSVGIDSSRSGREAVARAETEKDKNIKFSYNMQSLTDIGLSGKSESEIARLVSEGKLERYIKNGQYHFRWNKNNFVGNLESAYKNNNRGWTIGK